LLFRVGVLKFLILTTSDRLATLAGDGSVA